ncbi:hypothetical protein KFK09_020459 [Dendrobium nobile]|uniref:Uncharacterized protein n=1 Tax=Dendrobium nobile TaxID=94219 RepID=A0A8T3AL12_DENNO|nr:hypothetical protein KFK09_020459 [Dendrobium nobile]
MVEDHQHTHSYSPTVHLNPHLSLPTVLPAKYVVNQGIPPSIASIAAIYNLPHPPHASNLQLPTPFLGANSISIANGRSLPIQHSPRVSRVRVSQIHLLSYLHTSLATSLLPRRVLTFPLQIRHMLLHSIHITPHHHHRKQVHLLILTLLTPTHIITRIRCSQNTVDHLDQQSFNPSRPPTHKIRDMIKNKYDAPYLSWKKIPKEKEYLGRESTPRTHQHQADHQWVDEKAKKAHDDFIRTRESRQSTGEGSSSGSSQISEYHTWPDVVGGKQRGRVYSRQPAVWPPETMIPDGLVYAARIFRRSTDGYHVLSVGNDDTEHLIDAA